MRLFVVYKRNEKNKNKVKKFGYKREKKRYAWLKIDYWKFSYDDTMTFLKIDLELLTRVLLLYIPKLWMQIPRGMHIPLKKEVD